MEILRIDVESYTGKVHDRSRFANPDAHFRVRLSEKIRFESGLDNQATVWHAYEMKVVCDNEGGVPDDLMTMSVEFRIEYGNQEPWTREFFDEFKKLSLKIQTAPFARAWIQDHCLRMGVPPLILPLVRTV